MSRGRVAQGHELEKSRIYHHIRVEIADTLVNIDFNTYLLTSVAKCLALGGLSRFFRGRPRGLVTTSPESDISNTSA